LKLHFIAQLLYTIGDMLGVEQWKWLENELKPISYTYNDVDGHSIQTPIYDYDFLLIGSGISIVATDKYIGEGWRMFPSSRYRLLRLISKVNTHIPVLLLSGDIHMSEIQQTFICTPPHLHHDYQQRINDDNPNDPLYTHITPLIEVTSSGMTHSIGTPFSYIISLDTWHTLYSYLSHKSKNEFYAGLNYGIIHIDWQNEHVVIESRGIHNTVHIQQKYPFHALKTHRAIDVIRYYKEHGTHEINDTHGSMWQHNRHSRYWNENDTGWSLQNIQQQCNIEDQRWNYRPFNLSGIKTMFAMVVGAVIGSILVILVAYKFMKRWMYTAYSHFLPPHLPHYKNIIRHYKKPKAD
jgi:hypothetical protein